MSKVVELCGLRDKYKQVRPHKQQQQQEQSHFHALMKTGSWLCAGEQPTSAKTDTFHTHSTHTNVHTRYLTLALPLGLLRSD